MASTAVLKAAGLWTSPNNLTKPEGALIEASNVVIRRDDVVESRRGFKIYGSSLPLENQRVKQLLTYRKRILRHYSDKLQFDSDDSGAFEDFDGTFEEAQEGLRIRGIDSNGNFYFTSASGIKKISSVDGAGLTTAAGFIVQAGGVKAIDLKATQNIQLGAQNSFLPQDSTVAYRVLWNIIDANNNLVPGTPSQREIVSISLLDLLLRDYMNLLGVLDSLDLPGSFINDGDYVSSLQLPSNASPNQLRSNLISLVEKIDRELIYADNDGVLSATVPFEINTASIASNVLTIAFINVNPGAKVSQYFIPGTQIELFGTWTDAGAANISGTYQIVSVVDGTNSISLNVTGTNGAVTIDGTTVIYSNKFRSITQPTPTVIDVPTPDEQLVELQDYIDSIITALQEVQTETELSTQTNATLTLSTAIVTASVATLTFSVGDPRNYVAANGYINLKNFSLDVSDSINGLQQVASVTATTLTFATTFAGTSTNLSNSSAIVNKTLFIPETYTNQYLDSLDITTTISVDLQITIPSEVTINHFYQVYRSGIAQATGTTVLDDLVPNDEMQLVLEAFPTQTEIDLGIIDVNDNTPEAFKGANLYTNASTGEGITQANDVPPFAKDVNRFRNVVFYSNTKTRHREFVNLLGVQNMIDDYNLGNIPQLVISNTETSHTYRFVLGIQESVDITVNAAVSISDNFYFDLTAVSGTKYRVWYDKSGTATGPSLTGFTGIKVVISAGDTATQVASKTLNRLAIYSYDFVSSSSGAVVTVLQTKVGYVDDFDAGTSGFSGITTQGVGELVQQQITTLTCDDASTLNSSGTSNYFLYNTTFDKKQYYVWYKIGTSTDPVISGRIGIQIDLLGTELAAQVAIETAQVINSLSEPLFSAETSGSDVIFTNDLFGPCSSASIGTLPGLFSISITQNGTLDVLLSTLTSPARAVDETARSLIRVINRNKSETVYAYYLSGAQEVPGKILLEAKSLVDTKFYISGNNDITGESFSPNISPDFIITSITTGDPDTMTVVTSQPHGFENKEIVLIAGTDSSSSLDGLQEVTVVDPTTFRVPVQVNTAGTTGGVISTDRAESSNNEVKPNRVYYSKFQQPEAVPITNYFDVGASDKAILRIFPLRDSLFVFKEDGLYRISGESAPFNLALFDSSCNVVAPDSVDVSNNLIYGYTSQGISTISEAGVQVISRNIDIDILRKMATNFQHFKTVTFGVGYESDNSYIVWTVKDFEDEVGTIGYRFSTLTNTWTTIDKENTCAIVSHKNDKLYLGAGDVNYIEEERKSFDRTDYSDREYTLQLSQGNYLGNKIRLASLENVSIGDTITQIQTITPYQFNMLLKKLDNDPATTLNYESLLVSGGDQIRTNLIELVQMLDSDPGVDETDYESTIETKSGSITAITNSSPLVITSASHELFTGRKITITGSDTSPIIDGDYIVTVIDANTFSIDKTVTDPGTTGSWSTLDVDFDDIKACYNKTIEKINDDISITFSNYSEINESTLQEAIILNINKVTKEVTLNLTLEFIVGPMTLYKAIDCSFLYAPVLFGNPLSLKHLREATIIFERKNITGFNLIFSTDLLPERLEVPFNLDGNGIFGHSSFGSGYFGGNSHAAPVRTYIPRQCQRCTSLSIGYNHKFAREIFSIFGMTVTGEVDLSTRAYR